ncbi:hypothetical protein [Micromonospora sagamiensis]|uniref:hypothetical protein n=1 Tax=Micromonospora sagamiensis TaxID=47875 RepID=UPI0011AAE231|nr:hypothetical protein [Micromonospora sagamiensis]
MDGGQRGPLLAGTQQRTAAGREQFQDRAGGRRVRGSEGSGEERLLYRHVFHRRDQSGSLDGAAGDRSHGG